MSDISVIHHGTCMSLTVLYLVLYMMVLLVTLPYIQDGCQGV